MSANSYVWSLRYATGDPETGVVKRAGFTLVGTAPDGRTYSRYDDVDLPEIAPTDPGFVPLNEATNELVIEWMKAALGEERTAAIIGEFERALQPAPVNVPLMIGGAQ